MASKRFSYDKEDGANLLKVLGYSVASALLAALIAFLALPGLEVPPWVVPLIPAINVALVAVKKFVDGRAK